MSQESICAIIVSYFPSYDIWHTIDAVRSQVARVIVVDNGSAEDSLKHLSRLESESVCVIRNEFNMGIGAALNIGVRRAKELGFTWVLTLDQDTHCAPGMVKEMLDAYSISEHREQIAVLAPIHYDRNSGYISRELEVLTEPIVDRLYVMTSGNLIPLSTFEKIGHFDEQLFIEYVDNEFCLRAVSRGLRVVLVTKARMGHQLGEVCSHRIGPLKFFSHNYKPIRQYYRARNRLIVYYRYFGLWILNDFSFILRDYAKIVLVERDKWKKLKAIIRGTIDAFRGRLGRMDEV